MRVLPRLLARLRALWRRDVIADEISDELQFHLEMRIQELEDRGVPPAEARQRAAQRFGNAAVHRDRGYDIRGGGIVETVVADVRHAWYRIRRRWGYATAAILTLALGIGLTTALISIVDAAWLRPLPFPDPEHLVQVELKVAETDGERTSTPSLTDVRALREIRHVLDGIGHWHGWEERLVLDTGEPERVKVLKMSEDYADLYGVPPVLGRTFRIEDTRPGAPPVVVLGHAFWQQRFAGDRTVVGRTILLADAATTVVGVLPPTFHRDTHVWSPESDERLRNHRDGGGEVYARLRAGVALPEAERLLGAIAQAWPAEPDHPRITGVALRPLYDDAVAGTEDAVSTIAVSVLVLVALVCVNVSGLIFSDGADRRREFAVRASLGAGRGRLIRQMLTEAGVLGAMACVLGVLVAWWSLDGLRTLLPLDLPPHALPSINLRVLLGAVVASIVTVVAVSLWPAARLTRASLTETMSGATPRQAASWPRVFGRGIIAAEVALAVVLLTGGGLMLRSLDRLLSVDLGFQPASIVTIEAVPLDQSPAVWQQYFPQLLDRLRAVPGVAAAGAIEGMPLAGQGMVFLATGPSQPNAIHDAIMAGVTPGYLEALGVRLLEGRTFSVEDRGRSVVVLDETAARRLSPTGSAIGKSVSVRGPMTVIGVVSNVRDSPRARRADPTIYTWLVPHSIIPPVVVVRTAPGANVSVQELRKAALSAGTRAMVERIRPGSELLDENVAEPRHLTIVLGLLGGLGLCLTLVGTGGVTAYSVARRTQEVGIRMAFGASPQRVVTGITLEALRPILAGLALGLIASYYAATVLETFLFNTEVHDRPTFVTVAIVLGVATLIAAWLPARRAATVDPVQALRTE
ncbi:MAG: ADOP family duplicated permease [Acidobacteria bacterium]|nr:ADOP family duplicated permease [Acidobacteriota bacterium]